MEEIKRILIDSSLPAAAFEHVVPHVRRAALLKRPALLAHVPLSDAMVMGYGYRHQTVLITSGFHCLEKAMRGHIHGGMIVLPDGLTIKEQVDLTQQSLLKYATDLKKRHIIYVSQNDGPTFSFPPHHIKALNRKRKDLAKEGLSDKQLVKELHLFSKQLTDTTPPDNGPLFHRPVVLDSCVCGGDFRKQGYQVDWINDQGIYNQSGSLIGDMGDKKVLRYARGRKAVLITADADLLELAAKGQDHHGILILLGPRENNSHLDLAQNALEKYKEALDKKAVVIVQANGAEAVFSRQEQLLLRDYRQNVGLLPFTSGGKIHVFKTLDLLESIQTAFPPAPIRQYPSPFSAPTP